MLRCAKYEIVCIFSKKGTPFHSVIQSFSGFSILCYHDFQSFSRFSMARIYGPHPKLLDPRRGLAASSEELWRRKSGWAVALRWSRWSRGTPCDARHVETLQPHARLHSLWRLGSVGHLDSSRWLASDTWEQRTYRWCRWCRCSCELKIDAKDIQRQFDQIPDDQTTLLVPFINLLDLFGVWGSTDLATPGSVVLWGWRPGWLLARHHRDSLHSNDCSRILRQQWNMP